MVWKECHRILHKGCRLCINIGDHFARSTYYGRCKVIPIRTEIIKFCETIGFDYMGAIIWQKVTTCHTTVGAIVMDSYPYPRNGIVKLDYEFILIFKKPGKPPKVSKEIKEASKLTDEEWNRYFSGHWDFPGERQDKHLAVFPEELPKRLIKMFSFVYETVVDPFLGSGTTTLAAVKLKRNSIGYEINKDFLPIIKEKLGLDQGTIFADATFEIIKQEEPLVNFEEEIKKLPYIFRDPIKFDKKVDPRKLWFGSKIDNSHRESGAFYTVKEIISPEMLILNNGLRVKLLGVKEIPETKREAIQFLESKVRGQKVFLRFDDAKYDEENNLLCYVYLWNKLFVNRHLIKNRLVDVDTTIDYKYKSKFLALKREEVPKVLI